LRPVGSAEVVDAADSVGAVDAADRAGPVDVVDPVDPDGPVDVVDDGEPTVPFDVITPLAAGGAGRIGRGTGGWDGAAVGWGAEGRPAGAAPRPLPERLGLPASPLGNASRNRRATGASTVEDADFTNSPISLSLASTSLLVTPSSFASSCTRALPATGLLI
jgi:hypothetical protein